MLEQLKKLRQGCGDVTTLGLSDEWISKFLQVDPRLKTAIEMAVKFMEENHEELSSVLALSEKQQIDVIQEGIVNFYDQDAVNPYIAVAAKGPWIVTSCGAVVHDSGGYGMLGFGHSPEPVVKAMHEGQVIANIMTANFSQLKIMNRLNREIGRSRGENPYKKIIVMNSGSEAVTVGARLSDLNAAKLTSPGSRHEGKTIKVLAFKGGFHGRTDRPAQFSDSSLPKYKANLASFKKLDNLVTIEHNSIDDLKKAFAQAEEDNVFFEALFLEPVMGEGNPGAALDVSFYNEARRLTRSQGTLLVIDSIQAGLRAHGCLSLVDYPGFENIDPPDMETFSKALNAGQYPLSVLAMTKEVADLYVRGIYGNTMTANPRAIDVACAVLDLVDDELRANIRDRGAEFVEKLKVLQNKYPDIVTKVQGTGLLFSAEISPEHFDVVGPDGLELYLRRHGLGVIHGGVNALRFTPVFDITSKEVDMMVTLVEEAIQNAPRKS